MTAINEQKLPRFINVDVMGDIFKVPMCCIKRIPLLKAIAEEHPDQTIEIDEVSPDFFRFLTEYLKYGNEISFIENVKVFKTDLVDYWFKYLCMNNFLCGEKESKPRYVDKKIVVVGLENIHNVATGSYQIGYKLNNGDYITTINANNAICPVSGSKTNLDAIDSIVITIKNRLIFVPLNDVTVENNQYYVTFRIAVVYGLIENYKMAANLFGGTNAMHWYG